MRLINADELKYTKVAEVNGVLTHVLTAEDINNAPTVNAFSPDFVAELHNFNKGLIKQIEELERPQGEWVIQRLQNGFDDVYCPFCNARPTRSEYGYYLRDNFCHECGADMRGKEK